MKPVVRYQGDFTWEGLSAGPYKTEKAEAAHFRNVTRQVLFGSDAGLGCELRYFEIEPGGSSTLERHSHTHAVMILRGAGRVLVGDEVFDVQPLDLVCVAPGQWHQFRAAAEEPLGFLCLVDHDRDKPVRPTSQEVEWLRADPLVAQFIRP